MNITAYKAPILYVIAIGYLAFITYECQAKTVKDLKVRNCLQAGSLNVCRNALIGGNLTVNGTINGPNGPFPSFDVDNGTNVIPLAGVVQVSGTTGTGFVPSGLETHNGGTNDIFVENRRWVTQYVVDSSAQVGVRGTFQTIQGAIDAAVAAGGNAYILIRPGTYTENLTFHANLNIAGASCSGFGSLVTIVGNHTYTDIGECVIQDIQFNATSDDLFTINPATPGLCTFFLKSCINNNTGGRGVVVNAINGAFALYTEVLCISTINAQAIVATGLTQVLLDACNTSNTTVTPLITVDGNAEVIVFNGTHLNSLGDVINILATTAKVQVHTTDVNTQVTSPSGFFIRFIAPGNAIAAHVTVNTFDVSGNNVIGAGTYQYADIISYASNGIDQATTQEPYDWKPYATADISTDAVRGTAAFNETQFSVTDGFVNLFSPFFAGTDVVAPIGGPFTYTVLITDSFISVDTTNAPVTINLPALTDTGRTFTIKDGAGTAVSNPITVTTASGTVNIDGSTSQTISTAYGAMQVRFNGTSYQIYSIVG